MLFGTEAPGSGREASKAAIVNENPALARTHG